METFLLTLIIPLWIAILSGVIVSLVEYFFIKPTSSKVSEYYDGFPAYIEHPPFKFSVRTKSTIICGAFGAIIFPIIFAYFPDWRSKILDAFNFITTDPVEGRAIISVLGVIFGCMVGVFWGEVQKFLIQCLFGGLVGVSMVYFYGGIAMLIGGHNLKFIHTAIWDSGWGLGGIIVGMFFAIFGMVTEHSG